jgi:hypothetical protein
MDTIHQATAEARSGLKPEMESKHHPRKKNRKRKDLTYFFTPVHNSLARKKNN